MNSTNKLKIDISTEENRKKVLELFKEFNKINDIYDFFGVTRTPTNSKIAHEIADAIGFDLNSYKEKPKKYCLQCGKEITSKNCKKFCSSSCAAKHNNVGRKHSEETKLKIAKSLSKNETTGNIPLEVHHIDGDCTNNKEENLQLLCPNCHSLTSNHGSLNKLSKRYKLKKYKNLIK